MMVIVIVFYDLCCGWNCIALTFYRICREAGHAGPTMLLPRWAATLSVESCAPSLPASLCLDSLWCRSLRFVVVFFHAGMVTICTFCVHYYALQCDSYLTVNLSRSSTSACTCWLWFSAPTTASSSSLSPFPSLGHPSARRRTSIQVCIE